jgi:alpha-1,2-mannosyltransferase
MSGEELERRSSASLRHSVVLLVVWAATSVLWTWLLIALLHRFPLYPHFAPLSDLGEHLRDSGILWSGKDPYVLRSTLNDTTPPFTVLVYTPLRLVHGAVLETFVVLANVVALSVALGAGLRTLVRRTLLECLVLATLLLTPLTFLVLSQAAWSSLWWGQDQLIMLSLVVVDLLLVTPRWRGLLVGIAAGVLLSPAIFVVLLVRVGWPAVARMAGAVAGTIVLGALVNLHASTVYWLHLLPSGEAVRRVFILGGAGTGTVATPANYSLEGMLARRPFAHHVPLTATWLALVGVLAALSILVAWRAQGRHLDLTAMTVLGLASAALSPVGWDHHWIWGVMIPLVAVELWRTSRVVSGLWLLSIPMVFVRSMPLTKSVHWPLGLGRVVWSGGPPLAFIVLVVASAVVLVAAPRRTTASS